MMHSRHWPLLLAALVFSGCGGTSGAGDNDAQPVVDANESGGGDAPQPVDVNTSHGCTMELVGDDTGFSDTMTTDIPWSASGSGVSAIETAFNHARAQDDTVTAALQMPEQSVWDLMSDQQKALYLLTYERYDRGIKPFEGIDSRVDGVAHAYAQTLYDTGTFGHYEDGTPWERLDRVQEIADHHDFFAYGENLAAFGKTPGYTEEPIARSIYAWLYDDSSSSWGHRHFCLATGLNDNSGTAGREGLIGFGIVRGDEYGYFSGYNSTIIVMNAFDPDEAWDHSQTECSFP
jgi:uncharacterized protein YkwD